MTQMLASPKSHTSVEYTHEMLPHKPDDGVNVGVKHMTGLEIRKSHKGQFVLKHRSDLGKPNHDRNVSIPKKGKKKKKKGQKKLGNYERFLLLLNGNVVLNIFLSDILSSECSSHQAQLKPQLRVSQTTTALT